MLLGNPPIIQVIQVLITLSPLDCPILSKVHLQHPLKALRRHLAVQDNRINLNHLKALRRPLVVKSNRPTLNHLVVLRRLLVVKDSKTHLLRPRRSRQVGLNNVEATWSPI